MQQKYVTDIVLITQVLFHLSIKPWPTGLWIMYNLSLFQWRIVFSRQRRKRSTRRCLMRSRRSARRLIPAGWCWTSSLLWESQLSASWEFELQKAATFIFARQLWKEGEQRSQLFRKPTTSTGVSAKSWTCWTAWHSCLLVMWKPVSYIR